MLLIKTFIGPSSIHGTGLFAGEFIPQGTVIWRFLEGLDVDICSCKFGELPESVQKFLKVYAYYDSGRWMMSGDHGRFINHSENANTSTGRFREDLVAARDIQSGEEITEDYQVFDFSEERLAYTTPREKAAGGAEQPTKEQAK